MKIIKFTDEVGGKEAWMNWRLGKITGSRLKDIISIKGPRKTTSYALVAESFIGSAALAEDEERGENPMDRGTRLEKDAIERFRHETGKKVDDTLIGWERNDDGRIAISPDGVIGKTGAVEVKCLSAARHIEAIITKKIPKDYEYQALQYLIVNEGLKSLFFVMYDPRFPKGLDYYCIEIKRKDKKAEIEQYLQYQRDELKWVRTTIAELTNLIQAEPANIPSPLQPESDVDRVYRGMKERS